MLLSLFKMKPRLTLEQLLEFLAQYSHWSLDHVGSGNVYTIRIREKHRRVPGKVSHRTVRIKLVRNSKRKKNERLLLAKAKVKAREEEEDAVTLNHKGDEEDVKSSKRSRR